MSDEDRQLDDLLATVSWPAMPEEASSRLRATLRQALPAARFGRFRWAPLALAATVLIGLATAFIATRLHRTKVPDSTQLVRTPAVPVQPVAVFARQATMYERMLICADEKRPVAKVPIRQTDPKPVSERLAGSSPKPPIRSIRAQLTRALERSTVALDRALVEQFVEQAGPDDAPVIGKVITTQAANGAIYPTLLARRDQAAADLVIKLVQDPQTRPATLAALHTAPMPPTDLLIARLSAPLIDERLAAARALGSVCQGPTLDTLKAMVARDIYRREALAALLSCHDPSAGEYLSKLKSQPAIRAQLLAVQDEMKALF